MMTNFVSTNIRFANAADGENNWPNRKHLLIKILKDFSPEIFGTQEGREPQLRDLEEQMSGYRIVDQHREWIDVRMYPSIYIKEENVELLDSGDIWLSETPYIAGSASFNSAFPRLSTWAKVTLKKQKTDLIFVNLHLDHVLSETRHEQIKVLIQEIKKINKEDLPVILCGDFNESPFEGVRKELEHSYTQLFDPWFHLEKNEETSHHKFCGYNELGARIDWFLIDKRLTPVMIDLDKSSEGSIYPSDHFPLKLTLKL